MAAAMTSLPPPSTTTTGCWPTTRLCRHHRRQCCRHHALALASAVTIAAAFANVIASPMLLSMVSCCVVCHLSPAASSTVQICQPPLSCGASSTLFPLGRLPIRCSSPSAVCCSFTKHPAAYRPHHQAENVSRFHFLDLF
jgi:hypothetical protein